MLQEYWSVWSRVPPSERWNPIHRPMADDDRMTERDADVLITKYQRAMPGREYKKTSYMYDAEGLVDDDIPF